jgi:hypothetical protein
MAEIKAEFVLDENDKPQYFNSGNKRHYKIRLMIANAPPEAIGVTYKLHETYFDPMREAYDDAQNFTEEITSYGDYNVTATIRTKLPEDINTSLYNALKRTYGDSPAPEIQRALQDIKSN